MARDEESRLARWSRLKRRSRKAGATRAVERRHGGAAPESDTAPDAPPPPPDEEGPAASTAVAPPSDSAPAQAAAALPPIEALDKDSDFSPFLAQGVPEGIARAALRKLWRSDPLLANLDGLNDYDEDYGLIEQVSAALQTANPDHEGGARRARPDAAQATDSPADGKDADAGEETEEAAAARPAVDGEDEPPPERGGAIDDSTPQ